MNETMKLGGYLFVVCAVAGIALAGTNHLTADRIRAQKAAEEKRALSEVLPVAAEFRPGADCTEGYNAENQLVGYVLKVKAPGYSGIIEALVGVDPGFRIMGVKVLFQNETPGLGVKITRKEYTKQYIGRTSETVRLKKDGGHIDAITAATISSRALTDGIRKRIDEFRKDHP